MPPRITLNQLSELNRIFGTNEHFQIYDWEEGYERLKEMSEKQYHYLRFLLPAKKYFKIKEILDRFLKHK